MPLYFYLPPLVTHFYAGMTLLGGHYSGKCMTGTPYELLGLSLNFELLALMAGFVHLMVNVMTKKSNLGVLLGMTLNLGVARVVIFAR